MATHSKASQVQAKKASEVEEVPDLQDGYTDMAKVLNEMSNDLGSKDPSVLMTLSSHHQATQKGTQLSGNFTLEVF